MMYDSILIYLTPQQAKLHVKKKGTLTVCKLLKFKWIDSVFTITSTLQVDAEKLKRLAASIHYHCAKLIIADAYT